MKRTLPVSRNARGPQNKYFLSISFTNTFREARTDIRLLGKMIYILTNCLIKLFNIDWIDVEVGVFEIMDTFRVLEVVKEVNRQASPN
jgi:hypothetical protein